MRAFAIFLILLSLAITVDSTSFAADSPAPVSTPKWFSSIGFGPRAGTVFRNRAVNDGKFPASFFGGFELNLGVFELPMHTAVLGVGHIKHLRKIQDGDAQIELTTSFDRVDIWAGYDFTWKLLIAGLRVGCALTVIKTKMEHGTPTWVIADEDGDGEDDLVYTKAEDPTTVVHTGVDPGFLAGLGVGLSLGEILFDRPGLLEIRAQSDYVRRGAKNEFTVWGMIAFWPTRIARKNPK